MEFILYSLFFHFSNTELCACVFPWIEHVFPLPISKGYGISKKFVAKNKLTLELEKKEKNIEDGSQMNIYTHTHTYTSWYMYMKQREFISMNKCWYVYIV